LDTLLLSPYLGGGRDVSRISPGDRFGYWTAIEAGPSYPKGSGQHKRGEGRWRCRCDCGRERLVAEKSLLNGASGSCGCSKRINTIASIMGRLIVQENGCCVWPGCDNGSGYGTVMYHGNHVYVHRLLYEHFVGPIPEGLALDHEHCSNPPCANWAHLVPKTNAKNLSRNKNSMKTHCKNGHPLSGDNLRIQRSVKRGYQFRTCLACRVEYDRLKYLRQKAARENPDA
jgi:hypothetical protein